jgi:uncharacterized protein
VISAHNKQLMQRIFNELSEGNSRAFIESFAEDVRWTVIGSTEWSRTYEGKGSVQTQLLRPLVAQFEEPYRWEASRILADGDHVVVEARGRIRTKAGRRYDNAYCFVIRLSDGRVKEVTEYCDTQLVATALQPPPTA